MGFGLGLGQLSGWFLFLVHGLMQFKSFLRIPTITLNSWNEGQEVWSLNYPENCCVSQPGRACKQPFPQGTEQSHSWDVSRRPVDPDHSVTGAALPWDLGGTAVFNLCLLSRDWGQPHYSQQGLGASLIHARPGHGHPKQLDQVCTPLGRIPAACNGSTKAAMPENGLLEDGVSGDQSSLPTKHAFCSFLMSLKVCPLAVWRTWYPALRGRCKD